MRQLSINKVMFDLLSDEHICHQSILITVRKRALSFILYFEAVCLSSYIHMNRRGEMGQLTFDEEMFEILFDKRIGPNPF